MKKVLVIDDEPIIVKILKDELSHAKYQVDVAYDGMEAFENICNNYYDVIITDVQMPHKDGLSLLMDINQKGLKTIIIMMTAFGTINDAVHAIKLGAHDYITKPFEVDELLAKIQQALNTINIMAEKNYATIIENTGIIGISEEITRIKAKLPKIGDLDSTVLITGESGTGKGVLARELHRIGSRCELPFIHVNCSVLPPTLFESELFGHEKGAFTGATETKKGKIEAAGKGTIFLDEIGTLTPNLQAKLLTVLQERKIERVGGVKSLSVEARFIAATNTNLEEAVKRKEFRADLFYRLNVITIECPPLRFRKKDIKPLTLFFIDKFNKKYGVEDNK